MESLKKYTPSELGWLDYRGYLNKKGRKRVSLITGVAMGALFLVSFMPHHSLLKSMGASLGAGCISAASVNRIAWRFRTPHVEGLHKYSSLPFRQ